MSGYATGQKGFFQWLQRRLPRLYADVKREFSDANQLHGLGLGDYVDPATITKATPMPQSLSQTILDLANTLSQTYLSKKQIESQNKIVKVNLERAKAGQPPVDINGESYGLPSSFSDPKKMLLYGGLGLGVLLILFAMKPSRR